MTTKLPTIWPLLLLFFILNSTYNINIVNGMQLSAIAKEDDPLVRKELLITELNNSVDEYDRFIVLPFLSMTCLYTKDYSEAESYALKAIDYSSNFHDDWNYGNAIHDSNIVLGVVAFYQDRYDAAKKYLIEAGKASSSPQLLTFGPTNMILPNLLLNIGENEVVINYFQRLANIWKYNDGQLNSWITTIKGGGAPDFSDYEFP